MKVYVLEEFIRDDENLEYGSKVLNVYTNEKEAIKKARLYAIENYEYYNYMREDEPDDVTKYYCCLDNDPDCNSDYAKYMTIVVTEHELKENR